MIDVIITSYNEPNSTLKAVKNFLNQDSNEDFRIIVCDPFPQVRDFLKKNIKDKRVGFFLDPGEGKSYALNLLFKKLDGKKEDIFILTDGDVHVSGNVLKEISSAFQDSSIGCVCGHPIPTDSRNNKYGYWANVAFSGIHKTRKRLSNSESFMECSGYLFAMRKGVISEFPLDGSEDGIIPYMFWKKGYKIKYLEKAEVYVKNPGNWKDWLTQKIRNIKGHENYSKLFPDMPRTKSFWNEIKEGAFFTLVQPRNLKQAWWTVELYFARLYLYIKAFYELRKKDSYSDGWREKEIESTKPLD